MSFTMYSTATLTDTQDVPLRRRAALAILALKRDDETDEAFAQRVGLTSGKQQVSNIRAGGGVNLETLVHVAEKLGYSVDSMLGLGEGKPAPPPPTAAAEDIEEAIAKLESAKRRLGVSGLRAAQRARAAERASETKRADQGG